MKKDTRFSIRKLTVGVASIAVASFLTSGSVDAADLSILNSKDEKAAGYNPELPFEPFPPSISYTQPEAPWMNDAVEAEVPVEDDAVSEALPSNGGNPEAPFAPAKEANYENPEEPFAPAPVFTEAEAPFAGREVEVEEDEDVEDEPKFTEAEAPFAGREVEVEEEPEFTEAEAPFAGREVEVEEEPEFTEAEAPFTGREVEVEEEPEFTEAEAPFAGRVIEVVEEDEEEVVTPDDEEDEEDEEDLGFEILPGYKVEEAIGADGKVYKRLVPIEDGEVEEEVTPDDEEDEDDLGFEILPGYKVEEAIGADGKIYKRLVPIEDEEVEEETPVVEEDEDDLGFEILPGYEVEEVEGADGKKYKRLVPKEDEDENPDVEDENPDVEDETSDDVDEDELEVLPGYKVEEAVGADGKIYKRLVPIEEDEEDDEEEVESIPATPLDKAYKKTLVDVTFPDPTPEASENVATTRSEIENDLKNISMTYATVLDGIINNPDNHQNTKDFYTPISEAAKSDQGQTILADFLDHYRKAKEDDTITFEQLVLDSVGKKGGIYETLTVAAAKKLNFKGIEEGQDELYYIRQMAGNKQILYKAIMATTGEFGYYAPRKEAQEAVNKVYADMTSLLNAGTAAYRTVTGNTEATPNDALAAGLDYYRKVAEKREATLQDVVEELAQFGFNTNGALELAKQYAKDATSLSDVTEHYKETMGEKVYKYIQEGTGNILDEPENNLESHGRLN